MGYGCAEAVSSSLRRNCHCSCILSYPWLFQKQSVLQCQIFLITSSLLSPFPLSVPQQQAKIYLFCNRKRNMSSLRGREVQQVSRTEKQMERMRKKVNTKQFPTVVKFLKVDGRNRAQLDVENTYINVHFQKAVTALPSYLLTLNYPFAPLYIQQMQCGKCQKRSCYKSRKPRAYFSSGYGYGLWVCNEVPRNVSHRCLPTYFYLFPEVRIFSQRGYHSLVIYK